MIPEINKVHNENCLVTMQGMPDCFFDLCIASPPYEDYRDYNGFDFDVKRIAPELFRTCKEGSAVVWVMMDTTKNGSESGESFRQALYFMECGFKLHDTMIWEKPSFTATGTLKVRYACVFEYMFVFVKGRLKTFNPIKDKPNIYAGTNLHGTIRLKNGSLRPGYSDGKIIKKFGQRHNIWKINNQVKVDKNHPAVFPDQLAADHISSWSNESDLVYDPFMGSGTTAEMAIKLNRNWIGSEISEKYVRQINKRLEPILAQQRLFSA